MPGATAGAGCHGLRALERIKRERREPPRPQQLPFRAQTNSVRNAACDPRGCAGRGAAGAAAWVGVCPPGSPPLSAGRRVPGRGRHPVQCAAGWFRLQGEKQDASQPRSPKILSSAASKGSTCGHLRRLAPAQAPQVPFALLGLAPARASPHARRSPPAGGHATVTPALEGGRSLWPTSHEWKRQKPWCGPSRAAEGPWLGARSPCLVLLP